MVAIWYECARFKRGAVYVLYMPVGEEAFIRANSIECALISIRYTLLPMDDDDVTDDIGPK